MRLLVCTQVVDRDDPVLGFFHGWLVELAKQFESVEVLCLREGSHDLPPNVLVHKLGAGKAARALGVLLRSFRSRRNYDAVFVHMNQEYVLVAGWLWRLLGKRVYLWRNHYQGSPLTDLAALFCTKIFCTSKHSYTARYKKTVLMPVGVDTVLFGLFPGVVRKPHSVLFLARIAPSKRPGLLLEALRLLQREGAEYTAAFYGSPQKRDLPYYERLKLDASDLHATFFPAVSNRETPELYNRFEIFVNCSRSGMLDKTIFEAAACGCAVLAASEDVKELIGENAHFSDARSLVRRLKEALLHDEHKEAERAKWEALVQQHSLKNLGVRLREEMAQ